MTAIPTSAPCTWASWPTRRSTAASWPWPRDGAYLAAKKRWPDVDGKRMGRFDDYRCVWWVRHGNEGRDPFDLPRGTEIDDGLDRAVYPNHRAYPTLQECLLKAAHAVGALLAARKAKCKGKLGLRKGTQK